MKYKNKWRTSILKVFHFCLFIVITNSNLFPPQLHQVERAKNVGGRTAGAGERARRPQPVRAGASAVHANARGELLIRRGRKARLCWLRRHGLRGHHAFRRGSGEPQLEGELHRQGASTTSSLMISHHHHADIVLCAVTANDGGQKNNTALSRFFSFVFSFLFFLVIVISGLSPLLHCINPWKKSEWGKNQNTSEPACERVRENTREINRTRDKTRNINI